MRRKSTIFVVAITALAVMASVVAASALASKFMSDGNVAVTVRGSQIGSNVITIDGSNGTCVTVDFDTSGTVASPAASYKTVPLYEGCTFFGFVKAPVTTTGCFYTFSSGTESAADKFPGSMDLNCESGKQITIVAGTCEVTISGPQTFGAGLTFVNSTGASPKDVILEFNSVNIAVNKVKDGFLCPLSGTGKVNGTYSGDFTIKGYDSGGAQVGVTVEP